MSGSGGSFSAPTVDASGIYATQWTGGPAATQPSSGGASNSGSGGSSGSGASFQVESDGVRAQAAVIAQCGERIAQVLDQLRATLTSGGEPWGTDEMGQKFGAQYTGPANQGFASLAGLGTALTSVANQLMAQADAYDKAEGQIADAFKSIHTASEGAAAGGAGGAAGGVSA